MTTSNRKLVGAALGLALAALAGHASAGPVPLDLPTPPVTQSAPPPPVIFPVPPPGGGVIVGGQVNGTGGIVTHQPHGGGFTTNGAQIGTPGGTTFGGSVTTDPSGRLIGGSLNFGGTF
jgi:hypothetical protein